MDVIIKNCTEVLQEIELKDEFIDSSSITKSINENISFEDINTFEKLRSFDKCHHISNICFNYILDLLNNKFIFPNCITKDDPVHRLNLRYKTEWYNKYYNDIELHKKNYKWLNCVFTSEGSKKIKLFHDKMAEKYTLEDNIKEWITGAACELINK